MSKQKLSPKAARAKAVRDLAAANSPARKEKRGCHKKLVIAGQKAEIPIKIKAKS